MANWKKNLWSGMLGSAAVLVSAAGAEPGDLLVGSFFANEAIRFDGATGSLIGSFVSPGSGGLDGPVGIVYGPDHNLYVASFNTDAVLRYHGKCGTFIDEFVQGGDGGLDTPTRLVFGPDGNLYVSSKEGDSVLRYDGQTGLPKPSPGGAPGTAEFVASGSGGLDRPSGLVFGPDGHIYVAANGPDSVMRFDGATGAPLPSAQGTPGTAEFVTPGLGGLINPNGLTFGPDQSGDGIPDLYVTSRENSQVILYDGTNGDFVVVFVAEGSGGLDFATNVLFGPDGDLYVNSRNTNSIMRYDGSTGAPDGVGGDPSDATFASGGGLNAPTGLTFVPDELPEIIVSGSLVKTYANVVGPMHMSFGGDGSLYTGNGINGTAVDVHKIAWGGSPVEPYGNPLRDPDAVLFAPTATSAWPAGSLLVSGQTDTFVPAVFKILPDETLMELWTGGSGSFTNPNELAFDVDGRVLFTSLSTPSVWVSDDGGDPVQLITLPDNGRAIAVGPDQRIWVSSRDGTIGVYHADGSPDDSAFLTGMGVYPLLVFGPGGEPWGEDLYVIANDELLRVSPDGTTTGLGTGFGCRPRGFEFGPDGNLYVSLHSDARVVQITACPWDCADGDGNVGIVDFLALLAQWGSPGSCDFDGGGVGITDFLALLGNWGACP